MTIGKIFLKLKELRKKAKEKRENAYDLLTKQNDIRENKKLVAQLEMAAEAARSFNIRQKNIFLKP